MNRKLFNETTDSRTYRILKFQYNDVCCRCCMDRCRREDYGGWEDERKTKLKVPNWKLVSKNPKQWMKKKLKFIHKPSHYWENCIYTTIEW